MAERLTFVLDGRDDLSRVLGHAGDSAMRLRNTMQDAADGSNRAILTLTRDADGRLRDLNGQIVSLADATRLLGSQHTVRPLADWSAAIDSSRKVGEHLKGMLISLAPAAIPVAAALGPIAVSAASAGAAVGVFAAAMIPQIAAMNEAADAEKKYQDAVSKSGKFSKEAAEAQTEYARSMAKLPPSTRQAAAALSVFKDEFKDWSKSLSADTMAPFTKGLAVVGGLLPKLTPVVRGTSVELDRMMTLLAGGVQSPGFDRVMAKFADFSTGVLRRVNDGIVSLSQKLDTGAVGEGYSEFMGYVRANGPLVGETLRNIGEALLNVLEAGAEVGVGMLQVVNVLTDLVAAVPPEVLATFFQLAIAIKATTLAAAGMTAARAAMTAFGAQMLVMQTAAAGATGTVGRLTAAFGALSRGARLAVAGTGIGLLLIGLMAISDAVKPVAPDVDKLTTSLKALGESGKFSGELKRTFGDMDGFVNKVNQMRQASGDLDAAKPFLSLVPGAGYIEKIGGKLDELVNGDRSVSALKGELGAFDQSFAQLAQSGHADEAAAQFARFQSALRGAGLSTAEITALFPQYTAAVSSIKAEQELAARAMGLFGAQAIATRGKLDAQKASTDGLRQSIHALNNAMLIARGGVRGMEAAIDAASAAAKENGRTLDENTEKGRANNQALDDLAAATMKAAEGARENGASWETVNGIYDRGRSRLIASAQAMGLTKAQAAALAAQILRTPDKTARLKGNMEDLQRKLDSAKAQLRRVPDSRKAQIRASIAQLEAAIREARIRMTSIDGRTAHTYIYTHHIVTKSTGEARKRKPGKAGHYAKGGLVGFPTGGVVRGPGTGTSDSILAMLSNGEYVIPAQRVAQLGVRTFDLIRDGKLGRALPVPARQASRAAVQSAPVMSSVGQSTADTAALVRSVVAELMAGQGPTEVRVFVGNQELTHIARAEVRRANGELVQVLNAGGGG